MKSRSFLFIAALMVLVHSPMTWSGELKSGYSDLTPEERTILDRGEISDGAYVGGGVAGTLFGLGIGQAVQGRWSDKGWIFTVGEVGSFALMESAALSCNADIDHCVTPIAVGLIVLAAFRIGEIIDVWATPPELNRRYRAIKGRTEAKSVSFYAAPINGRMQAGLAFRF